MVVYFVFKLKLKYKVYVVVKRLFVVLLILVVWMGCWMDADLNGLNEAAFSGDIEKVKSFIVYCPIPRPT